MTVIEKESIVIAIVMALGMLAIVGVVVFFVNRTCIGQLC